MNTLSRVFVVCGLLMAGMPVYAMADEGDGFLPEPETPTPVSEEPVIVSPGPGVGSGIPADNDAQALDDQIAEQTALLESAQTDEERQLIENHIALLQQERASLESPN